MTELREHRKLPTSGRNIPGWGPDSNKHLRQETPSARAKWWTRHSIHRGHGDQAVAAWLAILRVLGFYNKRSGETLEDSEQRGSDSEYLIRTSYWTDYEIWSRMDPGYIPPWQPHCTWSYMFNYVSFSLTGCDLVGTEAVFEFPMSSLGQDT